MNTRIILFTWISILIAAGSVAAAAPKNDPPSTGHINLPYRSLTAIRRDVEASLRAEALSRRWSENVPEVIRLVHLYRELAAHPKRDDSDVIRELGLKLRARLTKVRDHIERRNADSGQHATRKKAVASTLVDPKANVLAQQIAAPGGAAPRQGAEAASAQPGAGPTLDYGPELVELIQRTISPAIWDINGGNGFIVYFAPRRVIVVSAPEAVHGQVGDVLGQLRAAQ